MRYLLRDYTMWVAGIDYGIETEELQCVLPDETYNEHMYGGTSMTAEVATLKIAALNPTLKMASRNPALQGLLMRPIGVTDIFTFRGALVDEIDGVTRPEVIVYRGRLSAPENDAWSGSEKAGIGYTIKGVQYMRAEIGGQITHEISLWPPRLVVNGVNRRAAIDEALGR